MVTVDTRNQEVGFNFPGQTVDSLRCATFKFVETCGGDSVFFRKFSEPYPILLMMDQDRPPKA